MRLQWLSFVLLLTNRIYNCKQRIIGGTGLGAVYNTLVLIFLEAVLAVVSFPLYLTTRPQKVIAFFSEKGAYEKIAFDYNLRRLITLTGVGIFALIWAVKLILIVLIPPVYGPLQLYSVGPLRPVDILSKDLIAAETGVQTARVVSTLPIPKLTEVKKQKGGNYTFSGTGQPGSSVVVLLSGAQTGIYTAATDKTGFWTVSHSQSLFRLADGNHAVAVFGYDQRLGVRSESGPEQYFKVSPSWQDNFLRNVDVYANSAVALVVILGVFLMFLTI